MTPPLLLALMRYAFLADREMLDDLNVEMARAYAVTVKLVSQTLRADDEASLVDMARAELLGASTQAPAVAERLAERLAFHVGLAFGYHLLRCNGR